MNDLMLIEYLKNKGMNRNISEQEFINKFEEFMSEYNKTHYMKHPHEDNYSIMDKSYNNTYIKSHIHPVELNEIPHSENTEKHEHFNEPYSKYLVSNMYHFENGRKCIGEKFDTTKAKEVCERYRGIIPQTVTIADMYLALNAQYHDYGELFKLWFGDCVEQKIIESAVIFWFKDDDYKDGFKLWNYFREY